MCVYVYVLHFIRAEVHGGASTSRRQHINMYTRASAPLLLCMHVHMNDPMTVTEQDIVGLGELYIVFAPLVLYVPSIYLP